MNKLFYFIIAIFISLSFSCNYGNNLSISTTDTNSEFKFRADYPLGKTGKLKSYLDSTLNNELPLDQNIDLFINLNAAEKFNLKAEKGHLEILFDKNGSSPSAYLKIKNITEGIKSKLTTH